MLAQPAPCSANTTKAGFSLVELLVTLAIATFIVWMSILVFGQVQSGTGTSLQRAQLALQGQVLDLRMRLDAQSMAGPNSTMGSSAGAIVIVPAVREGYVPLPGGQMSLRKVRLRSDQLAFLSDQSQAAWTNNYVAANKQWQSAIPTNLHDPASLVSSSQALIWYGAVQDASVAPGSGDNTDAFYQAHQWKLGRQCKLLTGGAPDLAKLKVTAGMDQAPGTLASLADAACAVRYLPPGSTAATATSTVRGPGWTDAQYVQYLASDPAGTDSTLPGAPVSSKNNYTNLPLDTSNISPADYRRSTAAGADTGLQFKDIQQASLRLVDNCSEVIVQWAGDLDKDGEIDAYPGPSQAYSASAPVSRTNFPGSVAWNPALPVSSTNFPGHPLAGSIIWYPEEIHDRGAWYNGTALPRVEGDAARVYRQKIQPAVNQWYLAFPTAYPTTSPLAGFPGQGPSSLRFGGHGNQSASWYNGFQFDYGERDGSGTPAGQASAPGLNVPAPYVFRFDDDQWRKVRYGFRQDGSVWANGHDGKVIPKFVNAPVPPAAAMWSAPATPAGEYADNAVVYRSANGVMNKYQARAGGPFPRGDPYDNAGATSAEGKPWIRIRDTASPSATAELGKHWFPYPPTPGINDNPYPPALYASLKPPTAATPLASPLGVTNFANTLGNWSMPPSGQPGAGSTPAPTRASPRATNTAGAVTAADWPTWTSPTPYATGTYSRYPDRTGALYFAYATLLGWDPSCANAPVPADQNRQLAAGTTVLYGGFAYVAAVNIPSNVVGMSVAAPWNAATAYAANSFVNDAGTVYYCSGAVTAGGASPAAPNPAWEPVTPGVSGMLWTLIGDPNTLAPNSAGATALWTSVPYPLPLWQGASAGYSKGQAVWDGNMVWYCKRDVPGTPATAWNVNQNCGAGTVWSYGSNNYTAQTGIPGLASAAPWDPAAAYPANSFSSSGGVVYFTPAALAPGLPAPPAAPWVSTEPSAAAASAPLWAIKTLNDATSWIKAGHAALGGVYPPPFGYLQAVTQTGDLAVGGGPDYQYARISARGSEPVYIKDPASRANDQDPYSLAANKWGPGNAYTITYNDARLEYVLPVNDPYYQGTRADWRNPQSDWPRLIRMRVRMHDRQGLLSSYSDEFLVNGRDNDGDGLVNNAKEGRMSGVWYEYVFAVPYPRPAVGEERIHTR